VRRFAASVALGLVLLSIPRRARADAHEGVSIFPPTGTLRAGVETEATGFRLEGQRGSFLSGIPRIEYTPLRKMNLRLRVPFHSLALDGEPDTRGGIGDMELRLRLNLRSREPLRVNAGWVVQMPTGSKHEGLGEGAVQLTPFASAGFRIDAVVLYLTVADTLKLVGPHEDQKFVNYVDPSENHELRTTAGTILPVTEMVSASAYFTETTILSSVNQGQVLLTGGASIGMQAESRLRIVLSQQLPIAGEHRFAWKTNASVTYSL
jgi:hypothetical protein